MSSAERAARAMHQIMVELGPRYDQPNDYPSWDDLPPNLQELTIVAMERLFSNHVYSTIDGKIEVDG